MRRASIGGLPLQTCKGRLPTYNWRAGGLRHIYSMWYCKGSMRCNDTPTVATMCWENMPETLEELKDYMTSFDGLWKFPCSFGAVDGCHIPLKCPKGGLESAKEYHNFKNFYSIVIMAIVDANKRFTWASSGYPGNSHDAIIFQSTSLFSKISNGSFLPAYCKKDGGVDIYHVLLGDSAFPFLP